jgi:hypothetical protein
MQNKTILQGILSFACLTMLSCGGDGRKPLDATSASLVLAQFKTQMGGIPTSNMAPTTVSGLTGVSASALSTKAFSCYTVTPDPSTDADGDGIAAEKTYTMDCTDEPSGGATFTQKGSIVYKDLDETVAGVFGGMRMDFNMPTFKITSGTGDSFNYSHIGFWEYKNDGGVLKSDSEYEGGISGAYHGFTMDYKYTQKWTYTMTPENSASPFTKGAMNMKGSFGMSGDFVIEDTGGAKQPYNGTWVISYTTKDLLYDNTCSQWYKSGSFFISDSMNTMELRYSCTTSKLYVNGVESDWWK